MNSTTLTMGGVIARALLQSAGGMLAAKGVISPSEVAPFVEVGTGAVLNIIALAWSWSQKKRSGAVPSK